MKRKNISLENVKFLDKLHTSSKKIGPQLQSLRPLEINRRIKKLIHYDCKLTEDFNDDVPDEVEVFVKENLLKKNKEEEVDDELSMVNINVSVLAEEDDNQIDEGNLNDSRNNADIMGKIKKGNEKSKDEIDLDNINDGEEIHFGEENNIYHNYNNPHINVFNINIDHRKNILSENKILKSHRKGSELMVRDVKSLHLITQKALLNLTKKQNDTFENNDKIGLNNFKSNSLNLFVSDQSNFPVGFNKKSKINTPQYKVKENENDERNVINIINFNNNYTIGAILLNNSNKSDKNQWRSPLDSSALNMIFKSSTPTYDKNFIFNKNFSLISMNKLSELATSKELKPVHKQNHLKQIIKRFKENKIKKPLKKKEYIELNK